MLESKRGFCKCSQCVGMLLTDRHARDAHVCFPLALLPPALSFAHEQHQPLSFTLPLSNPCPCPCPCPCYCPCPCPYHLALSLFLIVSYSSWLCSPRGILFNSSTEHCMLQCRLGCLAVGAALGSTAHSWNLTKKLMTGE